METVLSNKGGGSENDGKTTTHLGHNHHFLDCLCSDDHLLSSASIHHGQIYGKFPNPIRLSYCLLCCSHLDYARVQRPSHHATLEEMERKARYNSTSLFQNLNPCLRIFTIDGLYNVTSSVPSRFE